MATVVQRGAETLLEGIPSEYAPPGAIGALALALKMLGSAIPEEELLGLSGYAFRLQIMQPDWEAVALQATVGFDLLREASRALGISINAVPIERRLNYVRHEIDQGHALIVEREDAGLVVGYRESSREVLVHHPSLARDEWELVDDWTWDRLYTVSLKGPGMPPEAPRLRHAIEVALMLLKGDVVQDVNTDFFYVACGYKAFESWTWELRQPCRFIEAEPATLSSLCAVNAGTYECLLVARANAAKFLYRHIESLGPEAIGHLSRAAGGFERSAAILGEAAISVPLPFALPRIGDWSQAMRERQADALAKAVVEEEAAERQLRQALASSVS